MLRVPAVLIAALLIAVLTRPGVADAQEAAETPRTEGTSTGTTTEEPDATRLDVERLPPEAIPITRDLYAHGLIIEGAVGGRGFVGAIGRYSGPGPYAALGVGYEILDWLFVRGLVELSIHETNAPPPPGTQVFELFFALGEVRLQTHPTAEFALWLSAQAGMVVATTDALALYGFQNAATVGFAYGGEGGIDWHFRSRHFSIGLLGGVRLGPSLDGLGDTAIGVHAAAYIRYTL